jgi:hypothetical protein
MKLGPASRASVERTRYCVVGSSRVVWFNATFLLNGSDERQRSGRSVGLRLGVVKAPLGLGGWRMES